MVLLVVVTQDEGSPSGFKPLSRQEQRVLDGSIRGTAEKEIADEMGISEGTLREYKRRICAKTPGARTVREASWLRAKSVIRNVFEATC